MRALYLALFVIVGLIAVATLPAYRYVGDPMASQEEAFSIAGGRLSVDEGRVKFFQNEKSLGQYFVLNPRDGLFYSKFGIVSGILYAGSVKLFQWLRGNFSWAAQDIDLSFGFSLSMLNLVLTMLILWLSLRIVLRFSNNRRAILMFIIWMFYGTFLWNYLRAQTTEIFQLAFFLATFDALLSCTENQTQRSQMPLFAQARLWISLLCLSLVKESYLLLVALTALALLPYWLRTVRETIETGMFVALIGAIVGWVNYVKFGSPFLTGYHQWDPTVALPVEPIREGALGFLFDPQKSIFIYFPLLVFSLFGMPRFWKKHRFVSVYSFLTFAVFFVVIAKMRAWRGDSCYGPRYLLFALPTLCLPALYTFERMLGLAKPAYKVAALLFTTIAFVGSVGMQLMQNHYDFFAYWHVKTFVDAGPHEQLSKDLKRIPIPVLNVLFAKGKLTPPDASQQLRDQIASRYEHPNYFWERYSRQF